MAPEASPNPEQDAPLARLQDIETELDLFKLSTDIDDALLDASLDQYKYVGSAGAAHVPAALLT